jgi:SRSO17 transposase
MAARVAPADVQQLHHFVAASPWAVAPLEEELVRQAERLVGGPDAVLVIDDTALVKQGRHSVGVARQYCGQLGKRANCQALVSLTLARAEVPVGVGLRLSLPETWAGDAARRAKAGVPEAGPARPKWRIALDELDRIRAAGATCGGVLADAEYGEAAAFRRGLSERGLLWAAGILPTQKGLPGRRDRRAGAATAGGPAAQTPQALGRERERRGSRRGPARGGVPRHRLAARHQGAVAGRVRRAAHPGGGRPRGGPRPAPAG